MHLLDPLRTFIRMYDVLKKSGIMLTDTFDFKLERVGDSQEAIRQTISKYYVYKIIPYIYRSSDNQYYILLK